MGVAANLPELSEWTLTNTLIERFMERGGGGRLPNKGRYGCVASAKPRPDKIFPKKPNAQAKMPQNLITGQVFMNFRVPELEIFSKEVTFVILLSNITYFLSTIAKHPMPGQNLAHKT